MRNAIWALYDKTAWPDGPWQKEPDKKQWVDIWTGLPCLAVRSRTRVWSGYVGVMPGHPLYGRSYVDMKDRFEVRGGLTFSGPSDEQRHGGICHVIDEGEIAQWWWFGFHCEHSVDLVPGLGDSGEYRTLEYVERQCEDLALLLKGMTSDTP